MNNKQSHPSKPIDNSPINWDYDCEHCSRAFDGHMAHTIVVRGPHEADITCPWCQTTSSYDAPQRVERPPAIVCTSIITSRGLTVAKIFFEGGAWLQFHDTDDGRVREKMFNAKGQLIESFNAEIEYDTHNCCGEPSDLYNDPTTSLENTVTLYEKYTVRGLRIQMPHVYAVLINGH